MAADDIGFGINYGTMNHLDSRISRMGDRFISILVPTKVNTNAHIYFSSGTPTCDSSARRSGDIPDLAGHCCWKENIRVYAY
jgi:hypothetical protein